MKLADPAETILMSGTRPDVRLVPADLIGRAYRRVLATAARVCLEHF